MQELKIIKTTLDIGLGRALRFIHLTDMHLAFDDEGDERGRFRYFENSPELSRKFEIVKTAKYGIAHVTVLTVKKEAEI